MDILPIAYEPIKHYNNKKRIITKNKNIITPIKIIGKRYIKKYV
jgi:hypothetical protein